MNTNFKVIGLTRLGIKPESTASETAAHTTRPSELGHKLALAVFIRAAYRQNGSFFKAMLPYLLVQRFPTRGSRPQMGLRGISKGSLVLVVLGTGPLVAPVRALCVTFH